MEVKFRELKANEIDCRVSQIASNWLTLLLYKDARADMDVLDECVGCLNWKREHLRENANCRVSIYNTDINEWVSKEDTGTESFSEAEKGLASDSFKRACVNWGIGRELYTAPSIFIFPRKDMGKKTKKLDENGEPIYDPEFFEKDNGKYDTKTRFYVEYIDYTDDREIQNLIIRDNKNHIRFSQLTKEKEKELLELDMKLQKAIEKREETDKKFDREKFYKHYEVKDSEESTAVIDMTIKQKEEAIKLLTKEVE